MQWIIVSLLASFRGYNTTFPKKSRLNQLALYLKQSHVLGKPLLNKDQQLVSTATPQHIPHFSSIMSFVHPEVTC